MLLRDYTSADVPAMARIWNKVVEDGAAFPQTEPLDNEGAGSFFAEQTCCRVAERDGEILGMYILHPNNIGRVGHICNCSYAVSGNSRGEGVGSALVKDSLEVGKRFGFRLMQFNAVVASNKSAIHIYEKLGFVRLGVIPEGFLNKAGVYEDILLFYHQL